MARSIEEIQAEILEITNDNSLLSGINTRSRFSPWRAVTYVMAYATYSLEKLFDLFKTDITEIVTNNRIGSFAWYVQISKAFQLGDQLNEDLTYNVLTDNPDVRIVSRVAVLEEDDNEVPGGLLLNLKVAKEGTNANALPLTDEEKAQFVAYINKMKPAGVKTKVNSVEADAVKLINVEVFYDAIYAQNTIAGLVMTAINNYIKNIDFGGELNRNDLISAVRQAEGVQDFTVEHIEVRPAGYTGDGSDLPLTSRSYVLNAGYATFNQEASILTFTYTKA